MRPTFLVFRHFVPFNVFDAGDPPRLGGQLRECTACCAEHHPIFVPQPRAPGLPRALECPNLGSRGARRANGLSTLETGTIANTSNMHVAFALLALLGVSVTQRLRTTLTGTGKTPTVTVCLSLRREEAMLMNSPFTLGTRAGDPTKLALASAAMRRAQDLDEVGQALGRRGCGGGSGLWGLLWRRGGRGLERELKAIPWLSVLCGAFDLHLLQSCRGAFRLDMAESSSRGSKLLPLCSRVLLPHTHYMPKLRRQRTLNVNPYLIQPGGYEEFPKAWTGPHTPITPLPCRP